MKIIIFTYDRYDSISTSEYFKGIPHTVLCHDETAKQKFLDAGRIHGEIIATGEPKGLANNRNYAIDMMQDGEWALFFVDDLISMTMLESYYQQQGTTLGINSENQPKYRAEFKKECTPQEFLKICEETIQHAEQKGFALCGFSLTNNPLFRDKKFGYWALADGRCWLVKKTHLRFDTNTQLIDDTCFTALNLKAFGGIVNNNWVLPDCKRYTEGAFGTIEQRMPQKLREAKYLVDTYPEFVAYADKVGWVENSHVKIRQKRNYNPDQTSLF